jgi:glycosyltransferase involved in cell wall biosynthesis
MKPTGTAERSPRRAASCIVPAFNEAARITSVLSAICSAQLVDEIIVVDDGSEDDTAEVAASHNGALVTRLPRNLGKAGAMCVGARRAKNDVLVFLDADLLHLTPQHVDRLVAPVLAGEADMTVGQFWSGSPFVTAWMRFCPAISGQRAMRTADFLAIPDLTSARFGVEVVITRYAAARRLRTRYVHLPRITHVVKERKRGVVRGVCDRATMYGQIAACIFRNGYETLSHRRDGDEPG